MNKKKLNIAFPSFALITAWTLADIISMYLQQIPISNASNSILIHSYNSWTPLIIYLYRACLNFKRLRLY